MTERPHRRSKSQASKVAEDASVSGPSLSKRRRLDSEAGSVAHHAMQLANPRPESDVSASKEVLANPYLFDMIVLALSWPNPVLVDLKDIKLADSIGAEAKRATMRDTLRLMRVCKRWKEMIVDSTQIQRRLFFKPDSLKACLCGHGWHNWMIYRVATDVVCDTTLNPFFVDLLSTPGVPLLRCQYWSGRRHKWSQRRKRKTLKKAILTLPKYARPYAAEQMTTMLEQMPAAETLLPEFLYFPLDSDVSVHTSPRSSPDPMDDFAHNFEDTGLEATEEDVEQQEQQETRREVEQGAEQGVGLGVERELEQEVEQEGRREERQEDDDPLISFDIQRSDVFYRVGSSPLGMSKSWQRMYTSKPPICEFRIFRSTFGDCDESIGKTVDERGVKLGQLWRLVDRGLGQLPHGGYNDWLDEALVVRGYRWLER